MNAIFKVPTPKNEPVKSYAPKSIEREKIQKELERLRGMKIEVPMYIGKEEIFTNDKRNMKVPHDHSHILGDYSYGGKQHAKKAIEESLKVKKQWEKLSWEYRASIFLKAADLIAGPYRNTINAATMLCQGKNIFQAEIDAACEFADFLRFNVQFMTEIYQEQPISSEQMWNRLEYRPLEGFVYAITPFNFTAIAGNLTTAPAMMGNTIVWKPSDHQIYSAYFIMKIFKEAGLPDGVINMVMGDPVEISNEVFNHKDFAGVHFTGSTNVFKNIWKNIGNNIENYVTYPKIVGETGGKDFIFAHKTANVDEVVTAIVRGAFEFQGQKCSAASRAYIPKSLWQSVKEKLVSTVKDLKVGGVEDFTNFVNAVIHEQSFDKLANVIDKAKEDKEIEVVVGGEYDKSKGYFIHPTVLETSNPQHNNLQEEFFGPIITIYVYEDDKMYETMDILDETSQYALTGAILCQDSFEIEKMTERLSDLAGNFYINDKPTGAVVGQQPFGGARGSGTNDKAGAKQNLLRWVSPRLIKTTFVTPKNYMYPNFLED